MATQGPSRPVRAIAAGIASLALAVGCAAADGAPITETDEAVDIVAAVPNTVDGETIGYDAEIAMFDSSVVHDIEVTFDNVAYDEMIETYATTGDKDWIEATVVIDGTAVEDVGIRLKGNSSLFGLTSATAANPEDLPWLIRLDKYIDDQAYQGYTDVVIRSNSTETALNEAVAQQLLAVAGLANQDPIATAFTVNGGETELRLALEHPDDGWNDANFDDDGGALYKADSAGDYSYRGDDAEAYDDVFDQKAGADDIEPLIDFLEFINNADDETFNAEVGDRLDLDAFATYLAFQDLVGNADDINGRGNNSYLHYDYETERFTVVNWDLNLAFGTANVGLGAGGAPGAEGGPPVGGPPAGGVPRTGAERAGGPGDQPHVLVDRFLANDIFVELYESKTVELRELLYGSGAVGDILADWTALLATDASDLVDAATLDREAAAIAGYVATST